MSIDLAHVASRVFETPLLIRRGKLDMILQAIGPRILDGSAAGRSVDPVAFAAGLAQRNADASRGNVETFGTHGYVAGAGVGVLSIVGTLVRRGSYLDAESGLASYSAISDTFDRMLSSPSVHGIMLELDTPGGEAGGCFDLARHMRKAAAEAGKPVWAHANELAASSGYALASSASQIWVPTTGEVGSIGVFAAHLDVSGADAKAGLRWSLIAAGENKVDGNSHEPLSDRARAAIQDDVTTLYGMFVDLVAEHRPNLSASRVRATKADTYRGALALESGLADELGTFDQALQAFAAHLATDAGPAAARRSGALAPSGYARAAETAAAAQAVIGERARATELHGIAAMASRLGTSFDVSGAIANGVRPDAARRAVMDQMAEKDEGTDITAHAPAVTDDRDSARAAWAKAVKSSPKRSATGGATDRAEPKHTSVSLPA